MKMRMSIFASKKVRQLIKKLGLTSRAASRDIWIWTKRRTIGFILCVVLLVVQVYEDSAYDLVG